MLSWYGGQEVQIQGPDSVTPATHQHKSSTNKKIYFCISSHRYNNVFFKYNTKALGFSVICEGGAAYKNIIVQPLRSIIINRQNLQETDCTFQIDFVMA